MTTKYLCVEIVIGSVVFVVNIFQDYVIMYSSTFHSSKPSQIIDRVHDQMYDLKSPFDNEVRCPNPNKFQSNQWMAEGKEEVFVSSEERYDGNFGSILVVKTRLLNPRFRHWEDYNFVHHFINVEHPLIKKYCFVDNALDWRILDNNQFVENIDFPSS